MPMVNPDGHFIVQEIESYWRKNARDNNNNGNFDMSGDGVDLNRNYGFNWGLNDEGSSGDPSSDVFRGSGPFSEPETQAIRDLCLDHDFTIALNYHAYGSWMLIPWGYTEQPCPDHETYMELAQEFVAYNNYTPGSGSILLYPINGDAVDWEYGELGIFAFTVEVGDEFLPPDSQIPNLIAETHPVNVMAAIAAANPHGIAPPQTPVIDALAFDEDGNFTLSWTTPNPDPNNLAVSYDLRQKSDFFWTSDNAEQGSPLWNLSGFSISQARAFSGQHSYHSGQGNNLDNNMIVIDPFVVSTGMSISFQTWYNIENDWDYAYVAVSTDGINFTNLAGNVTTTGNPHGANLGNGITGNSNGWVEANFDLEDYVGQTVYVQIRYVTDSNTTEEGYTHPV